MVHPRQTAIAKAQAREYTPCPHLPPLANKVSQVEMEAGDCEGRLPPLFLPDVRCQRSDVRMTVYRHLTSDSAFYEHRHHGLSNLRRQWYRRF
jgi:hypothetical protein